MLRYVERAINLKIKSYTWERTRASADVAIHTTDHSSPTENKVGKLTQRGNNNDFSSQDQGEVSMFSKVNANLSCPFLGTPFISE